MKRGHFGGVIPIGIVFAAIFIMVGARVPAVLRVQQSGPALAGA